MYAQADPVFACIRKQISHCDESRSICMNTGTKSAMVILLLTAWGSWMSAQVPNPLSTVSTDNASPTNPSVGFASLSSAPDLFEAVRYTRRLRPDSRFRLSPQPAAKPATSVSSSLQEADGGEESFGTAYLKPALFVGGSLAITAGLIWTDQRTYQELHDWRQHEPVVRSVSPFITNLGDGRTSLAIFGGFLAYSYLGHDRSALQAGKIGLESFLLSGITAQILKHTFGRERPSVATVQGGRWNGAFVLLNHGSGKQGGYTHFDAFPSGHTATAFAAAATLSEVYGDTPWVSYASYSVASAVAVSRVMEQTHWLSDCFVGGMIGYFSTQLVVHLNRTGRPVALTPVSDGRYQGLALNVGL